MLVYLANNYIIISFSPLFCLFQRYSAANSACFYDTRLLAALVTESSQHFSQQERITCMQLKATQLYINGLRRLFRTNLIVLYTADIHKIVWLPIRNPDFRRSLAFPSGRITTNKRNTFKNRTTRTTMLCNLLLIS